MNLGFAVTWDNPDIELRRNGILVPSSSLEKNTEYEIVARIWNNSTDAPVVGLPVKFSYLSFGVGITSNPIGQTTVNLGVKGGPNHPAFTSIKWTTPDQEGHYCIQVVLDWIDDANPNNNLGQENTNVGQMHSTVDFMFLVRNATRVAQVFRFEVDSYRIPDLPPCDETPPTPRGKRSPMAAGQGQPPDVPARHDRKTYPVPAGWAVAFEPAEPQLEPGQEQTIHVRIVGPDGYKGVQPFNVHAYHRDGFAGGITLYVHGA